MNIKDIMEMQLKEEMENSVVKVIKQKEKLVRDTVVKKKKKKCGVVFDVKDEVKPIKYEREKFDRVSQESD